MRRLLGHLLAVVVFLSGGVLSNAPRTERAGGTAAASLFRPAVVAGGFVYVSGQTGTEPDDPVGGADIKSQTKRVIDRLQGILQGAGSSLEQTVSVTVYLAKASDFEAMNAVYRERFAEAPPTRTTIVAGLPLDTLVQMSAVAVPNGVEREVLHPAGWMKSPPEGTEGPAVGRRSCFNVNIGVSSTTPTISNWSARSSACGRGDSPRRTARRACD